MYGPNCVKNCSCPENSYCEPKYGKCICDKGWVGDKCSKRKCSDGLYGERCDKICECITENTNL